MLTPFAGKDETIQARLARMPGFVPLVDRPRPEEGALSPDRCERASMYRWPTVIAGFGTSSGKDPGVAERKGNRSCAICGASTIIFVAKRRPE